MLVNFGLEEQLDVSEEILGFALQNLRRGRRHLLVQLCQTLLCKRQQPRAVLGHHDAGDQERGDGSVRVRAGDERRAAGGERLQVQGTAGKLPAVDVTGIESVGDGVVVAVAEAVGVGSGTT